MTREEFIEKFAEEFCDTEWQRESVKRLSKYYFEHEKQFHFPRIDLKYHYGMKTKVIFLDDLEVNKQSEKKEHYVIKEREKKHNCENQFSISKEFTVSADMFKTESECDKNGNKRN